MFYSVSSFLDWRFFHVGDPVVDFCVSAGSTAPDGNMEAGFLLRHEQLSEKRVCSLSEVQNMAPIPHGEAFHSGVSQRSRGRLTSLVSPGLMENAGEPWLGLCECGKKEGM